MVFVEGVLVDLTHNLREALAVGIHKAVINQITFAIKGERIAELIPLFPVSTPTIQPCSRFHSTSS